jgi:hypothetical protein
MPGLFQNEYWLERRTKARNHDKKSRPKNHTNSESSGIIARFEGLGSAKWKSQHKLEIPD